MSRNGYRNGHGNGYGSWGLPAGKPQPGDAPPPPDTGEGGTSADIEHERLVKEDRDRQAEIELYETGVPYMGRSKEDLAYQQSLARSQAANKAAQDAAMKANRSWWENPMVWLGGGGAFVLFVLLLKKKKKPLAPKVGE